MQDAACGLQSSNSHIHSIHSMDLGIASYQKLHAPTKLMCAWLCHRRVFLLLYHTHLPATCSLPLLATGSMTITIMYPVTCYILGEGCD